MSKKMRWGWSVHQNDKGDVSVLPIYDTEAHEAFSLNCKCKPKAEVIGAHLVITHSAFDKRHIVEWFELAVKEARDDE